MGKVGIWPNLISDKKAKELIAWHDKLWEENEKEHELMKWGRAKVNK